MTAHALIVSPLYVGLGAVIFFALSALVIRQRTIHKTWFGDGGHADLQRTIRVQANFAEYTPLALLVIVVVEAAGYHAWIVHTLGIALVVGRLFHAWGLTRSAAASAGRFVGTNLTFLVLFVGGALLVWCFVRNATL
jgi:uncharacterized protein